MAFNLVHLIIQLLSGAVGGNLAGTLFKNISLGTAGNSIAGILGGPLGAYILNLLSSGSGAAAAEAVAEAAPNGMMAVVQQIAGGGVGGAVLMAIIGFIKKALAGNAAR